MPNANKKKHLQPKRDKVQDIQEFTKSLVNNMGGKDIAFSKIKRMSETSGTESTKNFWLNVLGHVGKLGIILLLTHCGSGSGNAPGCNVTTVSPSSSVPNGGSLISCPNSNSLVVNGSNGINNVIYSVSSEIQMCQEDNDKDKIMLKLTNGPTVVLFKDKNNPNNKQLIHVTPGSYSIDSCNFTVDSNGNVSW